MMDIVTVNLENEMDLMLAYKKSMKLCELCGMSVLMQTSFATAVSEIARCVIRDKREKSLLFLKIDLLKNNRKELVASIVSQIDFEKDHPEALKHARRLAASVNVTRNKEFTEVRFVQNIGLGGLLTEEKLNGFARHFKTELPLSPYDEIRKKNIMLLEVSEKLRNSENRYRDLTKTLPLMIFTTNALGNINYGNKWMMDFFKIAEIQSEKLLWTNFLHHTDHKKIREEWERAIQTQSNFNVQAKLKIKQTDGFVWHLISMTPVKNEDSQLTSWAGFFVDIHAQKLVEETLKNNHELIEAQKQLIRSQKNLEEKVFELNKSNHDLEQFAYIASHDLQEPLRKIRTYSNLVKKHIKDAEHAGKYLEKIEKSSGRMAELIRDVLNYSRLTKSDKIFEPIDLQVILKEVLIDIELTVEEKKAVVNVGSLPVINAVNQQMYQLFYNMLNNALKFNDGTPHIEVTCSELVASEIKEIKELHSSIKYVRVCVKDNGIGFDQKYASQIFTIFKRLHPKETYSGTGIGLALCKKIVDNHHGILQVKSETGKGTEFQIILPVE